MSRLKNRLPAIYKFFKKNKVKFNEFLEITGDESHKLFLENYEDLYAQHLEYGDLRFGQHMINSGIVSSNEAYNKEETSWLIDEKLIAPEYLLTWGTYGKDGTKNLADWEKSKPKLNAPLTAIEKFFGDYDGLKNYEIYAKRYLAWKNREPKPDYVLLKDLTKEHIEAILATQELTPMYRSVLTRLLNPTSPPPPPPVKLGVVSSTKIEC